MITLLTTYISTRVENNRPVTATMQLYINFISSWNVLRYITNLLFEDYFARYRIDVSWFDFTNGLYNRAVCQLRILSNS